MIKAPWLNGLPARPALAWLLLTCVGANAYAQKAGALAEDWFDGDEWHLQVRAIITSDELASYRRVQTEKQRVEFVAAFWAHRDPNPRTRRNEFRDAFERRVAFANQHYADPSAAPHLGFETDRGRIYILLGAPVKIERAADGTRETWHYLPAKTSENAASFEFVLPPTQSCDGGYRIVSTPRQSFRGASDVVQVFSQRFVTAHISVDFTRAASVRHLLTTEDGRPIEEPDGPIFDGQLGPAGADPLSQHFLTCRMFGSGGMGFTHQLPSGRYRFTSTIQWIDGRTSSDAVLFSVP